MPAHKKTKLAVWKFSSCDGCQLSLLDLEDELLEIAATVNIAYFLEASSRVKRGPYDLSIIEGSISTPHDIERIKAVREKSKLLLAVGSCAVFGGVQALRNYTLPGAYSQIVYEHPEYLSALDASSPVSAHVKTDLELRGCPPDQRQILEVLTACLHGKKPELPRGSVCLECKRKGIVCVMVSRGIPCLGPVTHAGCGALCPAYDRGCYGCFGPKETPNTASLSAWISGKLGMRREDVLHSWRHINGFAEAFCLESMKHESTDTSGGPEPD